LVSSKTDPLEIIKTTSGGSSPRKGGHFSFSQHNKYGTDMESTEGKGGAPTYAIDAFVAVLIMALGGLVIFGSRKLGAEWTSDGPGAGYFPFYIGIILMISGAGTLFQSFGKSRNEEAFVDGEALGRVLSVLLPAAVYVLGIQFLGIYLASAIYIALFMIILGKYSWIKSLIIAIAVNALFFAMFEIWFKVPLHKGTLEPLAFLGY
jgi:Tripartite tricarboxylate transporter TctB family